MRPFPLRELISPEPFQQSTVCYRVDDPRWQATPSLRTICISSSPGWQKQWTVLLHTGVNGPAAIFSHPLLQQQSGSFQFFKPEITAGWHFVMHRSTQASEETRSRSGWPSKRQYELISSAGKVWVYGN